MRITVTERGRDTSPIPKMSKAKFGRIEAVAIKLAEMDGWESGEGVFDWLLSQPYLRREVDMAEYLATPSKLSRPARLSIAGQRKTNAYTRTHCNSVVGFL